MKKIAAMLTALCVLFITGTTIAYGTAAEDGQSLTMEIGNPMMMVNGVQKEIDPGESTVPIIINGRTLVPIRAVIEELGGTVAWEDSTQTAILVYEDGEIRLTMNSDTAYFNGEAHTLEAAPMTINGRTMLPIRFIADCFLFGVNWQPEEQAITITKNRIENGASSDSALPLQQGNLVEGEGTRGLVVYFSATGTTKSLAEKIAMVSHGDLAEIVPAVPYTSEDLNYNNDNCRANQEINADIRPEIQPLSVDVEQYDVILLGYPIWWGQCPPAVLTFLESYNLNGKAIMPFCTSGSSGIIGSLPKISQLCPSSTVTAGLRAAASAGDGEITQWLEDNGFFAGTSAN